MKFDFELFSKIAAKVYRDEYLFSLDECLQVFRYYFETYEKYMNHPHPPICSEQISRIMWLMPWVCVDNIGKDYSDFFPDCYKYLINLHFKTQYRHCDYNINHFFSGKIRELRLHEMDAGYE